MRPRKEPPTTTPPVAKPAPFSALHTGVELDHMRQQRRTAERTTSPWGVKFMRVAIVAENGGIGGAGDGTEGWTQNTPETADNPKPIPEGGFAAVCGALCATVPSDLFLVAAIDQENAPRPTGFTAPVIEASAMFFPAGAGAAQDVLSGTSPGLYAGPGKPLLSSVTGPLGFTPSEPGRLAVSLTLRDPDTGAVATVSDSIPVLDCDPPKEAEAPVATSQPRKAREGAGARHHAPAFDDSEQPIGIWLNVPDPVNDPLEYTVLGKEERWHSDAETVEVWHDAKGYYYIGFAGTKVRLPERPR